MIQGLLGEMIERGSRLEGYSGGFHAPPHLTDRRPLAMISGATVLALLCSDPRLDPRKMLALDGTHTPVVSMIRVPGGRASLAIKALAGMQAVLNSSTILVIHHTGKFSPDMGSPPSSLKSLITVPDCGMSHVSDEECRQHLMKIVPENEKEAIRGEKFGEIRDRNFEDSIKEDVRILRESTWIKKDTRIVGLMYDTHTGGFKEIDDYEPENWPGAADGKKTDAQFAADYAALLEAR